MSADGHLEVPPERWVLFHPEQYALPGFPYHAFTRDTVCRWVCFREAFSGSPHWVPEELAYLTRNLSGLQGVTDETTLRQLRGSVDRARLASRQAIHRVAAPARPEVADALAEAAAGVAERLGLDLDLDLASGVGLAPARAEALVQIACEALTNVARHSGSRQAHLVLRRDGGRVHLLVRDQGRGFDTAAGRPGFGLRSMQARARAVGGELRVTSAPGAGSLAGPRVRGFACTSARSSCRRPPGTPAPPRGRPADTARRCARRRGRRASR